MQTEYGWLGTEPSVFLIKCDVKTEVHLPFFLCPVSAGFPSPADDYLDRSLDLNEHLIKNPSATFYVRAAGDSMERAGIFEGDLIMIDRSQTAVHNSIVLAIVNGGFTIKRLLIHNGKITLSSENPKYASLDIQEGMEFEIWGVATNVIHSLK